MSAHALHPTDLHPAAAIQLANALARDGIAFAAVSQLGQLRPQLPAYCFLLQLRGTATVDAKEGRFRLHRGDWIAFERDSLPQLLNERTGLTIAVLLAAPLRPPMLAGPDLSLFPGRGRVSLGDARLALRLWRESVARQDAGDAAAARPLLAHLHSIQHELQQLATRCPGRSLGRKGQVFARMQRVRLLLEGNPHRIVRLDELAQLSRFSGWWVSKSFHSIYGETTQHASMRVRMARARELLETTTLSVGELSESCGFQDPCSFARLFKSHHGRTPSEWRAMHRPPSVVTTPARATA